MVDIGYVYILCLNNGRYYVGSTNSILRRYREHRKGSVKSTNSVRPLKLTFFQKYDTLKQARIIEYRIKKFKRRDIIERIIKDRFIYSGD